MVKILLVEDDPLVAKAIKRDWPIPSDRIDVIETYAKCARLVASEQVDDYDVVILDMNLPDGNALQILRVLRFRSQLPALVISGGGDPEVRANTLDLGADDYVMKPFSIRELQARVSRAVKRLHERETADGVFQFDRFHFSVAAKVLQAWNRDYVLTNMESRLLFQLVNAAGKVCSRQHLSETVCFRPFRSHDKTIDIYIARLRTTFSTFLDHDVIETVRGVGYRFLLKPNRDDK